MRFRRDRDGDPRDPEGLGDEDADLTLLTRLPGRALRRLLERVDKETISLALRYARLPVVERVLRNVSARMAAALREAVETRAPVGREACLEAQHVLLETAYALEEQGEISFDGPADDAFPPLGGELERRLGSFSLSEAGAAETIDLLESLAERAFEHGALSLEPALERIPESLLAAGLRMVVDQLPVEDIDAILGRQVDAYVAFLERNGEILIEGVLSIALGEDDERARARLVSFLPEGAADYDRMPEMGLPPSAQATNDLIRLCCELAAESRSKGVEALEGRIGAVSDPLLRRGLEWCLEGYGAEEMERMLDRRNRTRAERERRKLDVLLEGFLLIREGAPPERVREALEGFLEEKA